MQKHFHVFYELVNVFVAKFQPINNLILWQLEEANESRVIKNLIFGLIMNKKMQQCRE